MAKTPKNAAPAPRPKRATAPVQFVAEDDDEVNFPGAESADEAFQDISMILKEHQNRQTKKASMRTTVFQTQKNVIYASARKSSQDLSHTASTYLEEAIAKIQELKDQEVSQEKAFGDYQQLLSIREKTSGTLQSLYPPLVNVLASRRSEEVNAASEMQRMNPSRRHAALRKFSKNARAYVEDARKNEQIATDASALLKHYKNLLSV